MRLDIRSLGPVTDDLEARRLRIAEALRQAMAEPAEASRAATEAIVELDEEPVATPPVPPLEQFGAMSPVAARALFGDH